MQYSLKVLLVLVSEFTLIKKENYQLEGMGVMYLQLNGLSLTVSLIYTVESC